MGWPDGYAPVLRALMHRKPLGLMCEHRNDQVKDKTASDRKNYLLEIQEFSQGSE
jgi:hypothetical protein